MKNFNLDNETLTFEVHNLNSSLCNALRRIIISEIETLGFRSSFEGEGDIINALEVEFRRDERVMRYLTVKLDSNAQTWAEKRRKKVKSKVKV